MKKIFGRLFALWAILIFVVTLIPASIYIYIIRNRKEPLRTTLFRKYSKGWMQLFFFCTGCRLKVRGVNQFQPGENYIVICNHNSLMDVPITTPFIPGPNKTIAKIEMAKIPLFGAIYRVGSVLVDRNDKNSRKESFLKMRDVLQKGMHMCIYPEGTRNRTSYPLKEFHDGAFKLAADTGKSILPAIIFNTRKVLPPGVPFYFWPSKMEIHFLPPVPVHNSDDYESLKLRLHTLMCDYYEANR